MTGKYWYEDRESHWHLIELDELNVTELRWLCRQYDLPESYDRDDMRNRIRARNAVTAHRPPDGP